MRSFAPVVAGVLAIATAAPALAAEAWTVDPAASSLRFQATQDGKPFEGRFDRFTADIRFSPDDLAASAVTVTVELDSAATGSRDRDGALPGREWFHTRQHPTATFAADAFTATGPDRYRADGTLTLKGETRPLALPFTLTITGDQAEASGQVTLDRTAFGVGTGDFASGDMVGTEVTVSFTIQASRSP